jgi:tyrosine-protein kinase Etk/Wzc
MKTRQVDPEINLKAFFRKAWKYKFLYLLSLLLFTALGVAYIKWVPPVYEVDTSILVDTKGNSRILGESQFLEGSVRLFETEKNLFNEMNILKSVDLIRKTVEDLDFEVSYHARRNVVVREHYQDYPVTVKLIDQSNQILNTPIFIEALSDDTYRVAVASREYEVFNALTYKREVRKEPLHFTKEHRFDEPAETDMYHFVVSKNPDASPGAAYQGAELYFMVHDLNDLVRSYQDRISVNQVDLQASIININAEGEVLEKEIDFLDQLTRNYIDSKFAERNEIAANKVSFIETQLASVTDSLTQAERSLEQFRRSTNAINLTQTGAHALEEYQQMETKEAQAALNLKYYQSLLKYVRDSSGIDQVVAPSVVGIDDGLLDETLLELKRLHSELARVKFLGGPKSRDVELISHQINNTTRSLTENLQSLIASTSLALQDLRSRKSRVEQTINTLPTREKNLINYQRKTKLFENLYNYLSQELAKTGIAQAENLPDIKIINHARMVGNAPKVPQKEMILLLAALLGLMIPSVFVYLSGEGDPLIDRVEMIEDETSIPVLAQIAADNTLRKKDSIIAEHWQTKESIRDLHANIKFFLPNYWKKVIAVTSSVPGEGKSFVVANLAMTMASAGNSVLLIDADFRNPALSRYLGVNPNKNLSTYLNGWIDSTEMIIQTHQKYKKLDFITTTAASTNPHRYLQNPKFEFMIIGLKDEYDHIIIDCPAVGLVSDYLLLFHLADIHLFVLRHKFSKKSYLDEIEKFKEKGHVENLYLVFNGVPGKKLKHGYFTYDSSTETEVKPPNGLINGTVNKIDRIKSN